MNWDKRILKGTQVKDHTGRLLGRVTAHEKDSLIIDGGKDVEYIAAYDRIDDLREDSVWLKPKAGLSQGALGRDVAGRTQTAIGSEGDRDIRLDLIEEELDVRKRMKQSGEVTVRKGVTTETRSVTVPVVHEEVHVERTPATGARAADVASATFREETLKVPVMEEEVEITKRPVVKEQLHVWKERTVEQRAATETVRREHAEVDEDPNGVARRGLEDDSKTWK